MKLLERIWALSLAEDQSRELEDQENYGQTLICDFNSSYFNRIS